VLGARALFSFSDGGQFRAALGMATGLCVLGLVTLSTRMMADHKLPVLNDVATDLEDVPPFKILAVNHTAGYPAEFIPLVQEYYEDIATPRTTSLPIGAAFIRALHIAQEQGWKVVTPIDMEDGHVAPHVWMDKEEVVFEAIHRSPIFKVADDIVVRVRSYVFDDGYKGARVDCRSRSHGKADHGVNAKRIRKFLHDADSW